MSWTRLMDSFHGSPKIRKLARALDVAPVLVRGHLATLWSWCQVHAPDGCLASYEPADIEDACEWAGAPGAFWRAAVDCRFIDEGENGFEVHEWMEYAEGWNKAERERKRRVERASRVGHACTTEAQRVLPLSTTDAPLVEHASDTRGGDQRGSDLIREELNRSDPIRSDPIREASDGDGVPLQEPDPKSTAGVQSVISSSEHCAGCPVASTVPGDQCQLCASKRRGIEEARRSAEAREREKVIKGELRLAGRSAERRVRIFDSRRFAYRRQLLLPFALSRERSKQLSLRLLSVFDGAGGFDDAHETAVRTGA